VVSYFNSAFYRCIEWDVKPYYTVHPYLAYRFLIVSVLSQNNIKLLNAGI